MSVHIENLHVGDWITGCADLRGEGEFGVYGRHIAFDGIPWKVKAISAPFVVAERGGEAVTFDLRVIGMTKVSAAYVRALRDFGPKEDDVRPHAKKRIRTKRDPRDCPRCGQRMVQRIPKESTKRLWHRVCPDCGLDQGPVEKTVKP